MICSRVSAGGRVGVPPDARTYPPPPRVWYHFLKAIALLHGMHCFLYHATHVNFVG